MRCRSVGHPVDGDHELLDGTVAMKASPGAKQRRRLAHRQGIGQGEIEHQVELGTIGPSGVPLGCDHGEER
jgi:hypothetical protein